MSKKFTIKPPIWPKELTFEEFKKLNPLINENQMIHLYNQYLAKFLNELSQQKIHFKQSLNKNLQLEINKFHKKYNQTLLDTELKYPNINFDNPRGPYGKGIGAEGSVYFDFITSQWLTETETQQPTSLQNQVINQTLILTATDGTSPSFNTGSVFQYPSYLLFITGLQQQINNHPLFTAQLDVFGQLSGDASKKRFIGIIIQQYLPGLAGNTVIDDGETPSSGGTLFDPGVEVVTSNNFTGGTDG